MFRILIAEDDPSTARLLCAIVKRAGYEPLTAADGVQALEMLDHNQIDLLLCDVMMPRMDGFTLTRTIRESGSMLPILMLTAKDMPQDKHTGFIVGTDDYMTKPFDPLEVVARVNSALRRFYRLNGEPESKNENHILKVGDLVLDTQTLALKKREEEIFLTPMEYKILALFMKNPGMIFTKVQIYENTCGEYVESDDNTIMVHISNLREKIEENPKNPQYIKTIRGVGYKIENR